MIPLLFHLCMVSAGQVFTCEATAFTGNVPLESGSRVQVCRVSIGVVEDCTEPFTGKTPLERDTKVVSCDVVSGIVSHCDATGFTGPAVLRR